LLPSIHGVGFEIIDESVTGIESTESLRQEFELITAVEVQGEVAMADSAAMHAELDLSDELDLSSI
jgi:hypothetical protein